jgi:hypothetical protein
MITLPYTRRGRRSASDEVRYQADVAAFCAGIREIRSRIDFDVSARGWCYLLEEHGLSKGDFDGAEGLINDCRKRGLLPLDIAAEDDARGFDNVERLHSTPEEEAGDWIYTIRSAHESYTSVSFWDGLPVYIQMFVEKIDLKSLFSPICAAYRIPIANAKGWSDINSRATMMR